jgi:hypothetical protein
MSLLLDKTGHFVGIPGGYCQWDRRWSQTANADAADWRGFVLWLVVVSETEGKVGGKD